MSYLMLLKKLTTPKPALQKNAILLTIALYKAQYIGL